MGSRENAHTAVQDSGLRWVNVGAGTKSDPGYQHWLVGDGWGIHLKKSVSGSDERGWRFWHVGCAPGGGEFFATKRVAFAAAEEFSG